MGSAYALHQLLSVQISSGMPLPVLINDLIVCRDRVSNARLSACEANVLSKCATAWLLVDDKIFEALNHCQCVNDIFAHVQQNPYALK